MGAQEIMSSLSGFLRLLGLGTLLLSLGCQAHDFIFPPERSFISSVLTIPRQLSSYGGDVETAGRLSYLLGVEGMEHFATLFPWVQERKVQTNQTCDPLTDKEKVRQWNQNQSPGKTGSCQLPPNYADLVMMVSSYGEVRCTREGCCSRGLCRLEGWSLLAKRARESPRVCYEKGSDSHVFGFGGLIHRQCADGDVFCGRLLCTQTKNVPILPDGSVILKIADKTGIICWGTDYHREMITVQIPDVEKTRDCSRCGEGFVCFNNTCNLIYVYKVDCVSDKCIKEGICRSHRNCYCRHDWDAPFFKRPRYRENIETVPPDWKPPRKSLLSVVIFHIRFFLLILSIGLAFLAKMVTLLSV